MGGTRQELIREALRAALAQQQSGAPVSDPDNDRFVAVNGWIDLAALADAVRAALGESAPADDAPPGGSAEGAYARTDEGRTPDELDASNDE